MIISRTPFRVSLFGGGTDLPSWLKKNYGKIFSFAIDKYCYISVRNLNSFFDYKYAVSYYKREHSNTYQNIKHPVVKNLVKLYAKNSRLEIEHKSDLPARSGIGSSSSFTVGLLNCFSKDTQKNNYNLSKKSIHFEQNVLKESVGMQDQIRAAYGGIGFINMHGRKYKVKQLKQSDEKVKLIQDSIVLVYTNLSRNASEIEKIKTKNIEKKNIVRKNMQHIYDVSCEAEKLITSKNFNIKHIGNLLSEQWEYKKKLSKNISNNKINDIYNLVMRQGAYGGKLMGAGSGGFLVFIGNRDLEKKINQSSKKLKTLKIKIDFWGSKKYNFKF